MKLPWMLIKLAGVFLELLQTGLKQQSNNDKKEMELTYFSRSISIFCQLVELYKENPFF